MTENYIIIDYHYRLQHNMIEILNLTFDSLAWIMDEEPPGNEAQQS